MPKHKKKRTKKYRATYKTDGRVDMSQGGRVGYREGEEIRIDPETGQALQNQQAGTAERMPRPTPAPRPPSPTPAPRTGSKLLYPDGVVPDKPNMISEDLDQTGIGQTEFNESYSINIPGTPGYNPDLPTRVPRGPYGGFPGGTPAITPPPKVKPKKTSLMGDAKRRAAQIVAGEVKPPQVPDAVKVEAGKAGVARTMDVPTELEAVEAVAPEAPEAQVVTGVEQAEAPTPLTAAQIEAAQVTEAPEVDVAEGEVRDEALAEAADVERVAPIEAAKVEIPEGALIEAVVGTVSPEAVSYTHLTLPTKA